MSLCRQKLYFVESNLWGHSVKTTNLLFSWALKTLDLGVNKIGLRNSCTAVDDEAYNYPPTPPLTQHLIYVW